MSIRRISSVAHVGNIAIGGDNPIRIQSMATTDTNDTEGSVAQAKRIIDAGGELVRFTTQGTREAENMKNISARLKADGYNQPLVADVHFTAHTADVAAQYCEKVRINPGNYVDPGRTFKHLEYTDEEYQEELKKIEAKLVPFINICKEHHTAVRIGVHHVTLWRYARGYRGELYGVSAHLPSRELQRRSHQYQGQQYRGNGDYRTTTGENDGQGGYALSSAPRCHRGW